MRQHRLVGAVAVLGMAAVVAAEEPRTLAGALPSLRLDVAGPAGPTETFAADAALAVGLLDTPVEETVRITDWPVAPGDRRTVEVTRHDVYAPGARIVAIGPDGEAEVPRSRLLFFWGTAAGDGSRRVLVSMDPDTDTLGGLAVTPEGVFEIRAAGRRGEYRIVPSVEPQPGTGGPAGGFSCTASLEHPDEIDASDLSGGPTTSTLSSLHTATVAVDTDNELLSLKFSDSTPSATGYLASLFAGMNVIYERDLFVRLLQGHTILRLSSAADPWTQPSCPAWPATCQNTGGADGAQLQELSSYWGSSYAAVPRALTMLLSGKQSSEWSASGIAWLNGLCSGSFGYSFSQVFRFDGSTAADDASLVAHELGHNFGAAHTHCYPTATTPIDKCYSGEGGCYSGPASCPSPFTITPINGGPVTNVTGTLMSYCHMLSGCAAFSVFHPQSVDEIGPYLDGKAGVCVFPNAGASTPTVSSVSPSSGPLGGGTTVTISGTGFASGATVSFVDGTRGVAAASVAFVSSTQLTAVTPAHAVGATDVVVGNAAGRTATKVGGFTFVPATGALVTGTKTVSGDFSAAGAITYTITLRNTGGGAQPNAAGDELADVLPSSLTLVSASAGAGSAVATPVTNTVTWNGSIASGATVTVTVHATVKAATAGGTVVSNQGTVHYDGNGDGTNETSTLTDDPGLPGAADATVFSVGLGFYTLPPCRVVDTRTGDGGAIAHGGTRSFTLAGKCGLTAAAKSVSVNVTVVPGSTPGNVVVYPGNLGEPQTATVNFSAGQTRGNNAIVGLATNGTGTLAARNRATTAVHLVVDVNGYFQ
jgi:uncharacterized repeat protein (TIGR01451 family)